MRRGSLQHTGGVSLTFGHSGLAGSPVPVVFGAMALSQLQCLDDNHVNARVNESKPEFLYCEDQRLALETLIRDGREAFFKYLESRAVRGFLSDPELETLRASVEPYEADSELFPENAAEGGPPLSLHYWPDLSDTSIPQMDLGWPDTTSYRGVTRTSVYCQPPIDGHAHIKEVVRRTIAQAQKVIAVAMDVFTDVDIFRDLLDVSFKKRVSVYIVLDRTTLPHFLSMCQRANMHAGHLKHLRVRCSEGSEFYTRSSTRVKGRLGHRFMFIDGDKAVSGSYNFTWMSSRLDRNLVTVVTGQAVDAFDKLFRILYANSSSVDLRQVTTEAEPQHEPEKDPLPQPATLAPPSAAIAMKLYNPKYNLAVCSFSTISSLSPAAGQDSSQKTTSEQIPKNPENRKKKRRRGASKESLQEPPPLHPCLSSLEKVCLISYLPTWPEPDPPSDVIGFINIRDTSKPLQAHLQRSEMFETSQVIRFSSPISIPKEVLPLVAKPRELIAKQDEVKKTSQGQTPAEEQPGDLKSEVENNTTDCEIQHRSVGNTRYELNLATESGHNPTKATPHLSKHKTDKTSEGLKLTTQADTTNSLILPGSNVQACESNTIANGFYRTQISPLTTDSSTGQNVPVIKMTPDPQTSSNHAHSSSSTSAPLITSSPTPAIPPSPESSSPPTPKPRTVQLVFKDTVHDSGQKLQEVSMVRRQQTNAELQVNRHPAPAVDLCPGNEPERNNIEPVREGKLGNVQGDYQETKIEEAIHDIKAKPKSKRASKSGDLRTGVTERPRDQEKAHKGDESTLGHIAVQSGNKKRGPTGFGSDEVTRENRKNVVKQKTNLCSGHTLQKIPCTALVEKITSELDRSPHMPAFAPRNPNTLGDEAPWANGAFSGPDISKELTPESHENTFSSENLSDARMKDLHLSIPDRELKTSSPLGRTPSTATPDPRLHTPDSRSRTPDFWTPTSDFSDGFTSPRALSSNSEEYYECSDFPFHEAFEHSDVFSTDDLRSSHANPLIISARGTDVTTPDSLAESSSSLLDLNIMKVEDEKNERESGATGSFKAGKRLMEVPSQETKRKIPSKAERLDKGGVTLNKMESKPSSTGDSDEGKRTASNDKRDGIKKTEELKLSHSPPQQDRGAGSPSTRTIPVENSTLPNAAPVTDDTDSKTPRKNPKRPPPPAQGQRQRVKTRQWQNKTPNPPQEPQQQHPDSQSATSPAQETQVDRKTPFSLTFNHLKGMINKLPAQSKKGSTSSPAQTRKSSG